MSSTEQKHPPPLQRRRYLVHLFCVFERECEEGRYVARICPWSGRTGGVQVKARERAFADECELIAVINPLLPPGSDVRNVFGHIESPSGFYYLLHLSNEEAGLLGWST
jgi:hypothetical protein